MRLCFLAFQIRLAPLVAHMQLRLALAITQIYDIAAVAVVLCQAALKRDSVRFKESDIEKWLPIKICIVRLRYPVAEQKHSKGRSMVTEQTNHQT